MDKGLEGFTLRYPYEVRQEREYFGDIPDVKVSADMLKLAEHIVESKAADFDPSELVDHYEVAVVEMLKAEAGWQTNPQEGGTGAGSARRQRHRPAEAQH